MHQPFISSTLPQTTNRLNQPVPSQVSAKMKEATPSAISFGSRTAGPENLHYKLYSQLSFADKGLLWTLARTFPEPNTPITPNLLQAPGEDDMGDFIAARLKFFADKGLLKKAKSEPEGTYQLCPQALNFLKGCKLPGSDFVMTPEIRQDAEARLSGLTVSELKALQRLPIFPNRLLERDFVVALAPNYLEQVTFHNTLGRAQLELANCMRLLSVDDPSVPQLEVTRKTLEQKQQLVKNMLTKTQAAAATFQESLERNKIFIATSGQVAIPEVYQIVANNMLSSKR